MTQSLPAQDPAKTPPWLFRIIAAAVAAVVLVVGYLVASVTAPMPWAEAVVGQLGGEPANSVPLGMLYGFTFTFFPLLLAWQCRRRRLGKGVRIALAAAAVLLTIPNLLTLGVMYGGSQSAVEARALWLAGANWFGTWSQIFMLLGAVCAIAGIVAVRTWLRRGREVRGLKAAQKLVRAHAAASKHAKPSKATKPTGAAEAAEATAASGGEPASSAPAAEPEAPFHSPGL